MVYTGKGGPSKFVRYPFDLFIMLDIIRLTLKSLESEMKLVGARRDYLHQAARLADQRIIIVNNYEPMISFKNCVIFLKVSTNNFLPSGRKD